ncbi:trypsin alpha-4-like [Eurosta solidaginis]|uniref:trypsin alpha-4-like n=1 Tax=Eurosta solidaginis TaxID=178769 RepID=UPI0035308A36
MYLFNSFAIAFVVFSFILTNTNCQYRFVGGRDANMEDNKHVVSINDTTRHRCTGALIGMREVLSTAHCIKAISGKIFVEAGGTDLSDVHRKVREAWQIHTPKNFNDKTFHMDIAFILLSAPFDERDDNIKEIPFCCTTLNTDKEMQVSSWGSTTDLGMTHETPSSSKLQSAVFKVTPKDECARLYKSEGMVLGESLICAKSPSAYTCQGDSGGPAVKDGKLWALVSARSLHHNPDLPALFTDISNADVQNFINYWLCH